MKYLFGLYLTFSVFFSSVVLWGYQNASSILFAASEKQILSFSFQNDVTKEFVDEKIQSLSKKYKFKVATLHSPADQYSEFAQSFTMYNQGVFDSEEIIKLIPYSVDFILYPEQNVTQIQKNVVEENIFQETGTTQSWLEKLKSISDLIENFGRGLFLFLFLTTAMMTVATIRILILKDDTEIKIRSYLGESFKAFVGQYLLKTSVLCIFSFCTGLVMTYIVYHLLMLKLKRLPEFYFIMARLNFLSPTSVLTLVVGFSAAFLFGYYFSIKQLHSRLYDQD